MEGQNTRRQLSRSSKPRLSQRKVITREEHQGSASRVSDDSQRRAINPLAAKRWVKILRTIFRSKMHLNMQYAVDRMRTLVATRYGKQHLLAYRLRKLFKGAAQLQKGCAFRKLMMMSIKNQRNESIGSITTKEKVVSKAVQGLISLLQYKITKNIKDDFTRLHQYCKVVTKFQVFNRIHRWRFFNEVVRKRLQYGFNRLTACLKTKQKVPLKAARKLSILQPKIGSNILFAFTRIRRRAAENSSKPQESNVEQPVQATPVLERTPDKRLVMNVDRMQTQNKNLKARLERDVERKFNQQKQLEIRLEEMIEVNKKLQNQARETVIPAANPAPVVEQPPKSKVYENIFTSLLFHLKHSDEVLHKEQLLESLLVPMSRVDMPVETIKMQNDILEQVLEQYKKLKLKVPPRQPSQLWWQNRPYEYLLKENRELYEMLGQLVGKNDNIKNNSNLSKLAADFQKLQKQLQSKHK